MTLPLGTSGALATCPNSETVPNHVVEAASAVPVDRGASTGSPLGDAAVELATRAEERPLFARLNAHGYLWRTVPIERLADLQEAIETLHRKEAFDEQFYREELTAFEFQPPANLPEARSLIVVTFRDCLLPLSFRWKGRTFSVTVPPSVHGTRKKRQAEGLLTEALATGGYRISRINVPQKTLAVCSGLARYGRNNLSYVKGMGSYHRPVVFASDMPCETDEWSAPSTMDLCSRCTACAKACPTGAISTERFLLHAERCITFLQGRRPTAEFPIWADHSEHNCVVGCILCQAVCPQNRGLLETRKVAVDFSEEETGLLLAGVPPDGLPEVLVNKLRFWDLLDKAGVLGRNLNALLRHRDSRVWGSGG